MRIEDFFGILLFIIAPVEFIIVLFVRRKFIEYLIPLFFLLYAFLCLYNKNLIPIVDGLNFLYIIALSLILSIILSVGRKSNIYYILMVVAILINTILIIFPIAAFFEIAKHYSNCANLIPFVRSCFADRTRPPGYGHFVGDTLNALNPEQRVSEGTTRCSCIKMNTFGERV